MTFPRRVPALALACLAFAALLPVGAAGADTSADLDAAKERLAGVEEQIARAVETLDAQRERLELDRREVQRLQGRVAALSRQIARDERAFAGVEQRAMAVREELAAARQRYQDVRTRLDRRARDTYINGPSNLVAVLDASSLQDLSDRVEFVGILSQDDADLSREAAARATELRERARDLEEALAAEAGAMRRLQDRRDRLARQVEAQQRLFDDQRGILAEQENVVAGLQSLQGELGGLIEGLSSKLAAEEAAAARDAEEQAAAALRNSTDGSRYQGLMPISYAEWATRWMPYLGAPACTNNLIAVVAWETTEYTQARWNPLATTKSMPGATDFNSIGVKNYASLEEGLIASTRTLTEGAPQYGYGAIIDSLRRCADPMITGHAINASAWCRGCGGGTYVIAVIPAVEAYFQANAPA